jgi:hypothetical protein
MAEMLIVSKGDVNGKLYYVPGISPRNIPPGSGLGVLGDKLRRAMTEKQSK